MERLSDILLLRREAEYAASTLPSLMMAAETISASLSHGIHAQRKSGPGETFWQFREYHPTDRPQDIDWRQSAKTDHVLIKQREWQTTQKTYLWCASGTSMDFSSDPKRYNKQGTAHIILLALALLLRQAEEQIGVFGDIKTGRSEETMQKIAQFLLDRVHTEEPLPSSMDFALPAHTSFIGVGDFLSPVEEIEQSFSALAATAKNALIVQVLDPAELDLPYRGRIRFRGASHEETVNNVASIRHDYKKRIEAHIEIVKDLCHAHHWFYVLHRTDGDIAGTLRHIWAMTSHDGGRG